MANSIKVIILAAVIFALILLVAVAARENGRNVSGHLPDTISARCSDVAEMSSEPSQHIPSSGNQDHKILRSVDDDRARNGLEHRADILWEAICQVESGGDPNAYNEREGAAGIAQIRRICFRDTVRISGSDSRVRGFVLRDRFDAKRSRDMFSIYIRHYSRTGSDEEAARIWNGGPRGMQKASTLKYWKKVKQAMEEMR